MFAAPVFAALPSLTRPSPISSAIVTLVADFRMDVFVAERLARFLMQQHGLTGWRFGWDRAKRRFGCCWTQERRITLSRPLVRLNSESEVRDTILHEIAHALVPGGHTAAWRRKCLEIGAKPDRCFDRADVQVPEIKYRCRYVARCTCPTPHSRVRRPSRTYICRNCRMQLTWTRVVAAA